MPDDKPTTQLPAVPEWAVELTRLAKTTKEEVRGLRADVGLVANDLSLVKERVAIIETWRSEQDSRVSRNSNRVRELAETTSSVDLTVQAKQSEMIVKQMEQDRKQDEMHARIEKLAASQEIQTAILARLDKLTQNPLVKTVATAIGTAVLTWLASKGLR